MALNGRWKKVDTINLDALLKQMGAIASPEELQSMKEEYGKNGGITEIKITGDKINIKNIDDGKLKMEFDYQFGKDTVSEMPMGKCVYNSKRISDTRIETSERWGDEVHQSVMRVEGGKLYVDYTANGVTCTHVSERI